MVVRSEYTQEEDLGRFHTTTYNVLEEVLSWEQTPQTFDGPSVKSLKLYSSGEGLFVKDIRTSDVTDTPRLSP